MALVLEELHPALKCLQDNKEVRFMNDDICHQLFLSLGRLTIATMIVPIVVAIFRKKFFTKPLYIFFYYCLATLFINLFEQLFIWAGNNVPLVTRLAIRLGSTTAFLLIFYHLKNIIFLSWFYSILLPPVSGAWLKRITTLLLVAFLVNYFFIEKHEKVGGFNATADTIFVAALPLTYCWYIYRLQLHIPIFKNTYFWLSLGLLVPNLVGFFLYFVGDAIYGDEFCLFVYVSIFKNSFEIIGQALLSLGFWYAPFAKYIPVFFNRHHQ